jgi:hypothetical protein
LVKVPRKAGITGAMLRISLLAALAALTVAAAPAGAQEKLCHGQFAPKPEPSQAEKELAALKDYARQRAEFGFRHDLAYVRKLVKAGVWEYDVGYIPVTPAENRYLKLRDELELGVRAERYLRAHADVDGGVAVHDDWPHEPYLMLHFTRDVAQHLAAVRALARYPDNLRAVRVPYSERTLKKTADRVWKDQKALLKAGFDLQDTGIGEATLGIGVITTRKDATAYFRKRYKVSAIHVEVEATVASQLSCAESSGYEIAPDGMSLTIHYSTGGSAKKSHVELTEFADHIEVGTVERTFNGPNTDDLRGETVTVTLASPLGARAVIDAANGKRLRQIGPSPGDPPCPEKPEQTPLENAIERRIQSGLPADPAYVQQRINSRSYYTPAEERWLARVEKLRSRLEKADKYINAHASEYGGVTIVANFPQAPGYVFHFTAHVAEHQAVLVRIFKGVPVEVDPAAFTVRQLHELEDRVNKDVEAGGGFLGGWGRAGFAVRGSHVDEDTNSVVLSVVTTRTDADAFLAATYGPGVHAEIVGDRFECGAALL